jgi:predicted small secreted protein
MVWKDFVFGVVATLGAEFVLAVIIVAVLALKSERAANKLLKAAKKKGND